MNHGKLCTRFEMHTAKVLALTTSSVVTPKRRLGSYVPAFLKTSAAIGTVELTGLLITFTIALGQQFAIPSQRVRTIPALMLNRSSLVIPGFQGHQQELSQDPSQLEHFPTVAGPRIHAPV